MLIDPAHITHYLPYFRQLPDPHAIEKSDLLNENFLMERNGSIEMYYAPHNEYLNPKAHVVWIDTDESSISTGSNQLTNGRFVGAVGQKL